MLYDIGMNDAQIAEKQLADWQANYRPLLTPEPDELPVTPQLSKAQEFVASAGFWVIKIATYGLIIFGLVSLFDIASSWPAWSLVIIGLLVAIVIHLYTRPSVPSSPAIRQ